MNIDLPAAVYKIIHNLTMDESSSAYLLIDKNGILKDKGGNLLLFGLESIEIGRRAADMAVFVEEILPLGSDPLRLAYVELDSGKVADIHMFPDNSGDWVVLSDKTKEAEWEGYVRQKKTKKLCFGTNYQI